MVNPEKHKGSETDNRQNQIDELRRMEKDVERRLTALENSVVEIRKNHLEGHKWFTTVIFTLVGFFLAYTANHSAEQVSESIRDMKSDMHDVATDFDKRIDRETGDMRAQVDKATSEMETKFQALAGESLKKPILTISTRQGLLDGQIFDISHDRHIPFLPLFLENIGDKKTGSLSVRLSASCELGLHADYGPIPWQQVESNDKGLPFGYYYRDIGGYGDGPVLTAGVAPKETLPFYGQPGEISIFVHGNVTNGIIDCRLQIFYEASEPAEANFKIKIQ